MMEEKFYHRYTGENRQRHLRKSRVDVTSLSWALCGEGDGKRKGEERVGNQMQQPRDQRYKRGVDDQNV